MNFIKISIMLFLSSYIFGGSLLLAKSCENKLFSLNIESSASHTIKLQDVINDLASSCKITVLTTDDLTKENLNKEISSIYVNDFTLDELFQLLLNEHNLFYTYDETLSRLNISTIQTKTFNIDYINVTQMRTYSTRDITVGASNNKNEDMQQFSGQQSSGSSQESTSQNLIEYSSISSMQKGENSDFTSTKAISDFTFWDELKNQVDGMLQRDGDSNEVHSMTMVNRDAGLIIVSGSFKQLDRVEKYIDQLQLRMHKQVLLEVRILEMTYAEGQQLGIDWSTFNLSVNGGAGANYNRGTEATNRSSDLYTAGFQFTMEGLMNFLKQYGEVEILSSPKVMTLNNQPALINVGDQINYKYETGNIGTVGIGTPSSSTTFSLGSVFVGLSLNIIPEITESGHIILRINPVDSRIINEGTEENGNINVVAADPTTDVRSIPPDMKIKQLTSIVKVKDGSKVLVGGLIQKEKFNVDNKIPVLGDIPYLGRLFHSTSTKNTKKEFFVVIIPTIIKEDRMPSIEDQKIIDRIEDFSNDDNRSIGGEL